MPGTGTAPITIPPTEAQLDALGGRLAELRRLAETLVMAADAVGLVGEACLCNPSGETALIYVTGGLRQDAHRLFVLATETAMAFDTMAIR